MTDAVLTITSERLTASISEHGAELQRLVTDDGLDLLWDGDPAVWQGRAPILFPVIGMLEGGEYRFDGRTYRMPKHGFARHSTFAVVEHASDALTLRLAASDATRPVYPFEFEFDLRFVLARATLLMTATVRNLGDQPMPASFGFHPALRWPLPFGQPRAAHRIRFEHEEPAPLRRIDSDGLLLPELQPSPIVGDTLMLRDDLFVADALIFDRIISRRLTYGAPHGPQIVAKYPDLPTLAVWTKPGAGYICIEPWQGSSDPVGYAGDIRDKPGIIEIAPGENRRFTMSLSLES